MIPLDTFSSIALDGFFSGALRWLLFLNQLEEERKSKK